MASYNAPVLTAKGIALLAKTLAGQTTTQFTKLATGSGAYSPEESLEDRTALKEQRQESPLCAKEVIENNVVRITSIVSNKDLESGYYIKEVGIFANDPDEGEILYSMSTAKDKQWDYFPPADGTLPSTITMEFYTEVGNASSVTIAVSSGAYASAEDVAQLKEQVKEVSDAATSRAWTVAVPAESWESGIDTYEGINAAYKAKVTAEGVTEDTDFYVPKYVSGSWEAAFQWDYLRTGPDSVTFWSSVRPTADFTLKLIEVK